MLSCTKETKFLRGNQKPHVDKNLRKAIMKRSQLKNKANRAKELEDITKYKKQQNLVVKLNRESKAQYFDNIQTSKNSKPFLDKCKPYFSNKHAHGDSKIILIEKENIITKKNEVVQKKTLLVNNDEIARTLNNHFSETAEKLNTLKWPFNEKCENVHDEKITTLIKKFENHPSMMKIKGTLMQIEKSSYMFVFISKQYPENFAFLTLRILELFPREVCKFLKK